MKKSRTVVVGGGAGGPELACKLGPKLGPERVTLVDRQLFHILKPSLHEVAAGTLDVHQEGLSYEMLSHDNRFTFCLGALAGLDLSAKQLRVASRMIIRTLVEKMRMRCVPFLHGLNRRFDFQGR